MANIFKFPNGGYEVTVVKKQDIIDAIDENIIDKDIALALVSQLEKDAADFIRDGKWTGLPFIGNVRVPKNKLMESSEEQQALIEEAKNNLDSKQYILFRKQLSAENIKQVKLERYYKYLTSIAVNRNRKLYKKLCKNKGECFARLFLYSVSNVSSINIEDNDIEYEE